MAKLLRDPQASRLPASVRGSGADSRFYQARTYLDGKVRLKSTKTDKLPTAYRIAEAWYKQQLRASVQFSKQHPMDRLASDATVGELFHSYLTQLERGKRPEAEKRWGPIKGFWGPLDITQVIPKTFKEFFTWRRKKRKTITAHTLHKDVVLVRQICKYAMEEGHLTALPMIPRPGKIETNPRPWLTRDEWDRLATTSLTRIQEAPNRRTRTQRQDLDDFMLFLVESMMRVNELRELTVGQVKVIDADNAAKREAYLRIDVHGKRGHRLTVAGGTCVKIFKRRSARLKPGDLLWQHGQRDAFRELLIAAGLREDAFGNERNLKSLRATAISFKILAQGKNANLLMIARAAGTSVTMIDTFYAKRLSAELASEELSRSVVGATPEDVDRREFIVDLLN